MEYVTSMTEFELGNRLSTNNWSIMKVKDHWWWYRREGCGTRWIRANDVDWQIDPKRL